MKSDTERPLPLITSIVGVLSLAVFGAYALVTILYVSPPNPLRIHFDESLSAFERWGFQKWNFFAPPPKNNDRLYFAFSPRSGEGVTIEVLEGIYARKRQSNPQNNKWQAADYTLSGYARNISDVIREIYRYQKVHELFEGDPVFLDDLALTSVDPQSPTGRSVRVLLRYAAMVATAEEIELDGLKCQIAFTSIPMRPFYQRYNTAFPTDEELIYRSGILDVPQLSKQ